MNYSVATGASLDSWLEQWAPTIYRFALRLCGNPHAAEDLAQESLIKAWKGKGTLLSDHATKVWLFRIVTNAWKDQLRRARLPEQTLSAWEEIGDPRERNHLVQQESLERALAAMGSLPDRQRQVLHLHACEGLSLDEIVEVLEISKPAVKASLCLARKRMRELLADLVPGSTESEPCFHA